MGLIRLVLHVLRFLPINFAQGFACVALANLGWSVDGNWIENRTFLGVVVIIESAHMLISWTNTWADPICVHCWVWSDLCLHNRTLRCINKSMMKYQHTSAWKLELPWCSYDHQECTCVDFLWWIHELHPIVFVVGSEVIHMYATKPCVALANLWWSINTEWIENHTSLDVVMIIESARVLNF